MLKRGLVTGQHCGENEEYKLRDIEDSSCGTFDMIVPIDIPEYGCACRDGFVRNGDKCVSAMECGCRDGFNVYMVSAIYTMVGAKMRMLP